MPLWQMPKYKLLLGALFGRVWEEAEVLRPLTQLTEAQAEKFRDYRGAVEKDRSMDPLRVSQLAAAVMRVCMLDVVLASV